MNSERNIINVEIDKIIPNRYQPRLVFDETLLNELANSIKKYGILQPLIVRPLNDKYEIIAGERRYKAACSVGLTTVPVIVKNIPDSKSAEIAIVENVQRKDLSPIEEAKSYKNILDKNNQTQEELARNLGVNQSTVANKLRLLNLTPEVQDALTYEKISERHARALLKITDANKQVELLNKTINERLTVKQLDDIIKDEQNASSVEQISLDVSDNSQPTDSEAPIYDEIETLDLITPTSTNLNFSNFFNSDKKEETNYPSLDDLITNMDLGIEDDIFNPFVEEEETLPEKQKIEVPEAVVIPEPVKEPEKIIKSNDLDSVKLAISKLTEEIKDAGFNINFEDFDFSDLYQVIIKIDK